MPSISVQGLSFAYPGSPDAEKALLAASLSERARLYIWDKPLNYIGLLPASSWSRCCCATSRLLFPSSMTVASATMWLQAASFFEPVALELKNFIF